MASDDAKENIADGLVAGLTFKAPSASSPKKSRKSKTRSKSIGPSGLSDLEEKPSILKESNGNRRKSAFIPAVKSILVSNDIDEKKRREARRKSLARRRVSFNPEATLHSWDVVAYARDETSSTVSDATRRASSVAREPAHPSSDAEEPPSTPPERIEEPEPEVGSSPANQRDAHKKKNRRSSGIPPMNFNNPDDIASSSPLIENTSPAKRAPQDDLEDAPEDNDSQSSARLDAALRKASELAGTQRLDLDSDEEMSMVGPEDEITASFKPWVQKNKDQEHEDPFSISPTGSDENGDEDMSMDITRAVGKIIDQPEPESPGSDDMSMDLTTAIGSIKESSSKDLPNRRKSLKRRVSMLEPSRGSPAKRPSSRRTSLRSQTVAEETSADDQTMDFTVAIGAIKNEPKADAQPPSKRTRASVDSSFGDETMDFTVAVGKIKDVKPAMVEGALEENEPDEEHEDMDLSMEFTTIVGPGIKRLGKLPEQAEDETVTSPTPVKRNVFTPQKSPRKSPGRITYPDLTAALSESAQKAPKITPSKSPRQPRRSLNVATPDTKPTKQRIEDFEPSPFVRSAPRSTAKSTDVATTPTSQPRNAPLIVPDDPIEAPILKGRRSSLSNVQFSPLAQVAEEPTLRSTAILSNNIKLLSTPRKQTLTSPVKRGMTPKKSQTPQKEATPKQKTPTPKKRTPRKSVSPKKRVAFGAEPEVEDEENVPEQGVDEDLDDAEQISLQEFLDLTRIRFMEVSASKRRHTTAPAAFHDKDIEEEEPSLDQYVVAGACTIPEYDLYTHACHELKKFISSGRSFVQTLEENVEEENPLLFSEYLTAPPDQRAIMDNQFKNLKTNARLEARGEWYTWRTNLLRDLKSMLVNTMHEFRKDESVIGGQEQLLGEVLPPLQETQERLDTECRKLQQRHDEMNSCNREELEQARDRLVVVDTELEEARQLVAQMQQELAEKEARIEAVKERKVECIAETKAAERVREEFRGWSTTEVNELHAKVTALEQRHGWSITAASGSMITMTYLNDLELYFQPSAFATGTESPNASISLTYVGDSATPHPRPLTTSKRFFLQLIRAYLHCIPQSQTRVKDLLDVIKNGWATASAVAEGVRWLQHSYITDESILSDERMAVSSNMLLPALQTKVKVTFEVGVNLASVGVDTEVVAKAELVYGEKFKTERMGAYLEHICGTKVKQESEMSIWADACLELVEKLKATGRKGERV
ncbi:hypothetical protein SLS60_001340 [Paraconiothyrium brasiliense]|uniref:Spc7 kinetochore protein domain-containing protein n=1 Tax=Paraconiothyrium brasiliense TaxID=300254 RepID=A0ABR3S9L1_9PLEO